MRDFFYAINIRINLYILKKIYYLCEKEGNMRFRTVVRLGVILSVILFCIGVGFYSFASLTEVEKGKNLDLYTLVPGNCSGVLETDNIDFYTSEFPRMAYAGDLDTLRHAGLLNTILNELIQFTSTNSHGLGNQMNQIMLSFHNPNSSRDIVAYFRIGKAGKNFLLDMFINKYGEKYEKKKEKYRGENIEIFPVNNKDFLSVFSGEGFVAVSYQKRLIEEVIDTYKDKTSLRNDPVFSTIHLKKSANYMSLYGRTASFPLLSGGHTHCWSEFDIHLNSDVLYLSGSMHEPDSCMHDVVGRLNNIKTLREDSLLIVSGREKVDSCISEILAAPRTKIFDECISNLSREASYIMVVDMDKVADNPQRFREYLPSFIIDHTDFFRPFIVSVQVSEINGKLSHIYVFTYKE